MRILATALAAAAGVVMMAGSALAQSPAYCDQQARQYANAYASPGQGVVGGAVGGGILGGIASGIAGGNVGTGIAAGAVGGGVIGGIANKNKWQQYYNQAYYQCMNTPVSAPQPPVAQCPALVPPSGWDGGYQVGSPGWVYACDQRYKSFDPNTWLFNGYDGCKHYCNLPG